MAMLRKYKHELPNFAQEILHNTPLPGVLLAIPALSQPLQYISPV
jgi:hypothetical protein